MQAILLIYNVLLFLIYCIPLLLSLLLYVKNKENIYLYIMLLYGSFCLDELVIYLTEFIHWFSSFYKQLLFTAPTFKTIIYFLSFLCIIKICEWILSESLPLFLYVSMVGWITLLLCILGMHDSSLKLWLYYTTSSIFYIVLGLDGFYHYKKIPKQKRTKTQQHFGCILLIFTVCYVIVILEDSFTLFNPNSLLYRSTRSFSEDGTRIFLSTITIIYLIKKLFFLLGISFDKTIQQKNVPILNTKEECLNIEPPPIEETEKSEYSKFYLFCKKYRLTTREQDILLLLLDDKTNVEISETLIISLGTTKTHIHNIYSKLEVKKRKELLERYTTFDE